MPRFLTRDVSIFYRIDGPADAPALVFSSSLGTTHAMWDAVVALLDKDFRCIRYDTRGHGASSSPANPFTVADLADDLAALMHHLGVSSADVAGLSLGGMTAQSLAVRHPSLVRSLTLMATSAFMPTQAAWNNRAALVRREGTKAIIEATLQRWFTPQFLQIAPPSLAQVRDAFITTDRDGYAACCEAIGAMDLRPDLAKIAAPTLIIAGRNDPATPVAMMEEMAANIDQATLAIIPDAAHLLAVEQPHTTAQLLRASIAIAAKGSW
ncbi:MAG: 3-oxoadipate enol-lactonase [Beijerinckiaceae bacterium]